MKMYSVVLCVAAIAANLCSTSSVLGRSHQAQCLLEVKGVHYYGGPCIFQPLDREGSFRIVATQKLRQIVQVNVFKKDEANVAWNGQLGDSDANQQLGAAYRTGACWKLNDADPDSYNDSRICAWTLRDDVYLGPSPPNPDPALSIYYGSRVGMYNRISSRAGIDTSAAKIVTKPSIEAAIQFCREYNGDYSKKCINDQLRENESGTIVGNCQTGNFSDLSGQEYRFMGEMPKGQEEIQADYKIERVSTDEVLFGDVASGYEVALSAYKALCPATAPKKR
jgi:hypothetical protein